MSIELSYEELDGYVQQVCTGKKLTYISNKLDEPVPLLFKYPTPEDNYLAKIIHDRALAEAESAGLPSLKEMEKIVRERGIYTEADEEQIAKLRSRIEGQQAILKKTVRVPARRDRVYENIRKLEEEVSKISLKKEPNLAMTCERKAAESKFLFLTSRGVCDPFTGERYWKSNEEFENESDFLFRKRIFLEYIVFAHGLKQEVIRYVARSNLWRIRYVTALKTGDNLFGCPIRDYNTDQLTLLYWSHFYQSVYEMLSDDRPPDTIIEDDQALDAYMNDWQAERNRDATAARSKKNNKYGQNSAWDHGETLVMKSNPVHSDVEYSETLAEKSVHGRASQVDAAPMGREAKKTGLTKAREDAKTN
jgi:hypothetical protein